MEKRCDVKLIWRQHFARLGDTLQKIYRTTLPDVDVFPVCMYHLFLDNAGRGSRRVHTDLTYC